MAKNNKELEHQELKQMLLDLNGLYDKFLSKEIPENKIAEFIKISIVVWNTVIDYFENINEIMFQITGQEIKGFEKQIVKFKKLVVNFSSNSINNLDAIEACKMINELISNINKEIIFAEIEGKTPQRWHKTFKNHLKDLEEFKEKEHKWKIIPSHPPENPYSRILKNPAIKEPTLRELALYYEYLNIPITKDNADEKLKGTKHTSGAKLKQNYDIIHKTINRINIDTDRKNNHRLKEFENVISMLKKTENLIAIEKANSEFQTFKNKLD